MPDVLAGPVVTAACFSCCRRAMGAACTRHSLRPLDPEGAYMIKTRAKRAAGMRSRILTKQHQAIDRKSRSTDSHHQSIAAQLQMRCSLPFTNRHRRWLLPQFNFSAGGGGAVLACVSASLYGTARETYANAGIRGGRKCLTTGLSIRVRFFDPGACWGLCGATKESLATMQWGQDRRRRHAR
jgi:hypothetical protein